MNDDLLRLARFCESKRREYSAKLLNIRSMPSDSEIWYQGQLYSVDYYLVKYSKLRSIYSTQAAYLRKEINLGKS
jgi:hypothetical protein